MRALTGRRRVLAHLGGRSPLLGRAGVPMPIRQACLVAGLAAATVLGRLPLFPLGVVVGALLARPVGVRLRSRRAAAAYDEHLAAYLRVVGSGLRSGLSLREAVLGASAPIGPLCEDLVGLRDAVAQGATLAEVLTDWATQRNRADVRLVAAGFRLGLVTGGVTATVVDGLADTVELGVAARADAVAFAAQARLSALVLGLTPLALGLGQIVTGGPGGQWLLGSAPGRVCLGAGVACQVLGGWWMQRLVEAVA